MKDFKQGSIHIGKLNSTSPQLNNNILIEVIDKAFNTTIEILLTPEEFGNAITGAITSCKFVKYE